MHINLESLARQVDGAWTNNEMGRSEGRMDYLETDREGRREVSCGEKGGGAG